MHGRRHLLALLAAVTLFGTASFVLQVRDPSAPAPSRVGSAAFVSSPDAQPPVLAARATDGVDQLVSANTRPQRLAGLIVVALLVLMAVHPKTSARRTGPDAGAAERINAWTRFSPPRGPPLLQLSAF